MGILAKHRAQKFTIIAKDPSVEIDGKILTAEVEIPAEELGQGPRGYRVYVVDYDLCLATYHPPIRYKVLENGHYNDPFKEQPDKRLINSPSFHAQNVYAIVMRILWRFEYALGRRVSWGFGGHQIYVVPHALAEANAFYSKYDRALLFGYFPKLNHTAQDDKENNPGDSADASNWVFTCLSHDIVAHETTHALLDGLRERFTDPSSPEQAGFHEGFADVVALLSIFSLRGIVEKIIDSAIDTTEEKEKISVISETSEVSDTAGDGKSSSRISIESLKVSNLQNSLIYGLGKQMGEALKDEKAGIGRATALRQSVTLQPPAENGQPPDYYMKQPKYQEPHYRGELFVAAMMNAFTKVWIERLKGLGLPQKEERSRKKDGASSPTNVDGNRSDDAQAHSLSRERVVEEGAVIADHLLTMVIRAIDYTPPTDLEFCDFLSALLTADREMRPDDSKYRFRKLLVESFASYGVNPTSKGNGSEPGIWEPPNCVLTYERIHLQSMMHDTDEMFRFIWENRDALGLDEDAYTRVLSVRPCIRINADDGFVLRETVAEYYQILQVRASELMHLGIQTPEDMPDNLTVSLYGGGTLIFDEFGRVKYHIRNRILNPERQKRRLWYLWEYKDTNTFEPPHREVVTPDRRFEQMHQMRFTPLNFSKRGMKNGEEDFY